MKISIKLKFTAFLGLLLLLTVSLLSLLVLEGIKNNQKKEQENYLIKQSEMANLYIYQAFASGNYSNETIFLKNKGPLLASQLSELSSMPVELYNSTGKKAGGSVSMDRDSDIKDILSYSLKGKIAYQVYGDFLDFVSPVQFPSSTIGAIHFRYSLKESKAFYKSIENLLTVLGCVIFIFSFFAAYLYFNNIAKIITSLKRQVSSIEAGIYSSTKQLKRRDELSELSRGINIMSSRIHENIEELTKREQNLQLAVAKLKKLEQAQKQFIGNITHEFKTPLTIMRAYMDLIELYSDDIEMTFKAKKNINTEIDRLYKMVEKSLHLSEIEKLEFEESLEKIDLSELLGEVIERMKGKAEKFQIRIDYALEQCYILADKDNLSHIFINLLDNAIKYNKPGGLIKVKNCIEENNIYVEIKDTGIGIPLELKDKIFEPFYRIDKELSRQTGGTGLGLALVKTILEKHEGSIYLQESSTEGSTFLVTLKSV